jgi:hypothetical protein
MSSALSIHNQGPFSQPHITLFFSTSSTHRNPPSLENFFQTLSPEGAMRGCPFPTMTIRILTLKSWGKGICYLIGFTLPSLSPRFGLARIMPKKVGLISTRSKCNRSIYLRKSRRCSAVMRGSQKRGGVVIHSINRNPSSLICWKESFKEQTRKKACCWEFPKISHGFLRSR